MALPRVRAAGSPWPASFLQLRHVAFDYMPVESFAAVAHAPQLKFVLMSLMSHVLLISSLPFGFLCVAVVLFSFVSQDAGFPRRRHP